MDRIRNYQRCNVMGEGTLFVKPDGKAYPFYVIDISASGVKIRSNAELELNDEVEIDIRFSGHILEIPLKVDAKVAKKTKTGKEYEYALRFLNLSHQKRVEIDEIVRRTCGIENMINYEK